MPVSLASTTAAATKGALVPIAYASLSSDGFFDFTNIPQNYQDLFAVVYSRSSSTFNFGGNCDYLQSYFNNTTPSIFSFSYLNGSGSSIFSNRFFTQNTGYFGLQPNNNATAGIFGTTTVNILDYASTTKFKTILSRSSADINGTGNTWFAVNLWRSTDAITGLNFYTGSGGVLRAGSTAALYGVRRIGQ